MPSNIAETIWRSGRARGLVAVAAVLPLLLLGIWLALAQSALARLAVVILLVVYLLALGTAALFVVGARRARRAAAAEQGARAERAARADRQRRADDAAALEAGAVEAELVRGGVSTETSVTAERAAVLRTWASVTPRSVAAFGAKNDSPWARDVLAHRATHGRHDYKSLLRALRSARQMETSAASVLTADFDAPSLLSLERLVLSRDRLDENASAAMVILDHVVTRHLSTLGQPGIDQVAEHLMILGDHKTAARALARLRRDRDTWPLLAADLLNPFRPEAEYSSVPLWLRQFNEPLTSNQLEPVKLLAEGATPYDRLDAATPDVIDGPLISVIMSCFHPDGGLLTAIRSMIGQTWRNWELIVVDDGSPKEFDELLESLPALDRRIRVIRNAENRGTYYRRSQGIRAARGEFVTMHDSDDWAHPRRLEVQAQHLQRHPEIMANVTSSLRVSEDLCYVQPRGATYRLTETSLLFRRTDVVARIGYYDPVRKSADSEYRLRIEAAFGAPVPLIGPRAPLMLVRYTSTSLTATDFGDGWMHSSRVAYKSAWVRWHQEVADGLADPRIDHPSTRRFFPVDPYLTGGPRKDHEVDLLVVADFRPSANVPGALEALTDDIQAMAENGVAVGISQIDSLSTSRAPALLAPALQDLLTRGDIGQIHADERVVASTVVVTNASVLQGLPVSRRPVEAGRVVVVEDPTSGRDRRGYNFVRRDVTRVAQGLFGREPEYLVTEGGASLAELTEVRAAESEQAAESDESRAGTRLDELAPVQHLPHATSFAASVETQSALIETALDLPEDALIVEAGSGFSTLRLAAAAARNGRKWRIVSLEHDARYAAETRAMLESAVDVDVDATTADVRTAPLTRTRIDGELYDWYAPSAWEDLHDIKLLFVDGPPASIRVHSRYPALRLLKGALADSAIVVLDDVVREDEQSVLEHWESEMDEGESLVRERLVDRTVFLRFRRRGSAHAVGARSGTPATID